MQEVDEFRREKYARDDEHTKAWPLTALGAPPKPMADPRSAPAGAAEAGFYPASEFAVHRSLLGGNDGGLHWPPSLLLSSERPTVGVASEDPTSVDVPGWVTSIVRVSMPAMRKCCARRRIALAGECATRSPLGSLDSGGYA